LLTAAVNIPANGGERYSSQFKNNYFTEMCSGSEVGSYLRRIDFVYHSTLGLRVIKKKKNAGEEIAPDMIAQAVCTPK